MPLTAIFSVPLLALPFVGLWTWLAIRLRRDWREAFALTSVAWVGFTVALVELASIGAPNNFAAGRHGHLTATTLCLGWTIPALLALGVLWRVRHELAVGLHGTYTGFRRLPRLPRYLCLFTMFSALVVGVIAVFCAPNNWDSMVYHLPRVVAWARLGGVVHYPTHIEFQLFQPPGAEMLVAQWYILWGHSDRLAASVQWFAFGGSMLLTSLAAQRLGAGRRGQLIASFLVATTPMAIMQGSSTQNDLVAAYWLLVAATLALGISPGRRQAGSARGTSFRWAASAALAASLALGLAVLTKGTSPIFALPIALLLLVRFVRVAKLTRTIPIIALGIIMVLAPNIAQWSHNQRTFHTFIATGDHGQADPYRNTSITPDTVISNLVRNATLHLNVPNAAANRLLGRSTRGLLHAIGINPDDPTTTFLGGPFRIAKFGPQEDHTGNLAMLLLSLWALGAVLFVRRFRTGLRVGWIAMLLVQLLLFCALIKWQVFNSRLHLAMFILVAPLIASCLDQVRHRWIVPVGTALVAATSLVWLGANYTRPIVGPRSIFTASRATQLFIPRPQLQAPYTEIVDRIAAARIRDVGIIATNDDWEYPLEWLGSRTQPQEHFSDVLVTDDSARYQSNAPLPNAVICLHCSPQQHAELNAAGLTQQQLRADGTQQPPLFSSDVTAPIELWLRRS